MILEIIKMGLKIFLKHEGKKTWEKYTKKKESRSDKIGKKIFQSDHSKKETVSTVRFHLLDRHGLENKYEKKIKRQIRDKKVTMQEQ